MQSQQERKQRPLPQAETGYTVDPLSDLVSATELRIWRNDPTTRKLLRYLTRWREQLKEHIADGGTLHESVDVTAIETTEASAKAQLLKDILTLEAVDVAQFYGLGEPNEGEKTT